MYEKEKQGSPVRSQEGANTALRNKYHQLLYKGITGCKGIVKYIVIKLCYGQQVSMRVVNSLKGNFVVSIPDVGKITIGEFLMCAGPAYLKAERGGEIVIGNRVFLNHNFSATAMDKIVIGNNCNVANNCVIVDHDHAIIDGSPSSSEYTIESVHIGNRVWIGANVTILKGVTIGDDAVIAAGAVVTHDVKAGTLVAGVPARTIQNHGGINDT